MFAVPEVDDNIDISSSTETKKLSNEPKVSIEAAPLHPPDSSAAPISTIQNEKTEKPPPSASTAAKPHLSRTSLFHRNTIDICDHLGDRL